MGEDDFESLHPPPYTLMADDSNGVNLLGPTYTETLTAPPRARPASAPTNPTVPETLSPLPTQSVRYVYYQIFGSAAPLSSKYAFNPEDDTVGRVPARKISPPRTAAIVKRYIAQYEGIDASQIEAVYPNAESDTAIPDDTRIAIFEDGGPGTSMVSPLAIILRDSDTITGVGHDAASLMASPLLMPSPFLPGGTPPSPAVSLPRVSFPPDPQPPRVERSDTFNSINTFASRYSNESSTTALSHPTFSPPPKPKWTIEEDGFGEPIQSSSEAGKVVSQRQPPGWLSGRVQTIGHGIFMGKLGKKHGNITQGGSVLRDGMRLWVDARKMKNLTIRTGDTFRTYRVIIQETREMTFMWTGDISIDSIQT